MLLTFILMVFLLCRTEPSGSLVEPPQGFPTLVFALIIPCS